MRFSVVITCYNQRGFIAAAVRSALSQHCTDREIIVVDDGSSDGSVAVLEQFDAAVQLVKQPENLGALAARNAGAAKATGEYLVFLDGDDLLMPWTLSVYERIISARRPKLILGSSVWFQDAPPPSEDTPPQAIEYVEYDNYFSKDRPIGLSASTMVIEREAFQGVGGWSPEIFHLDCQELLSKLGSCGPLVFISSPSVTLYRIHQGNSIHNVAPFMRNTHRLMDNEKAGCYPGGDGYRFRRYASLGGLFIFWLQRGLRAGLYAETLRLAASGWRMILAALLRRAMLRKKRRPVESLAIAAPRAASGPS